MEKGIEDQIIAVLEQTKAEIQANMQARNINASGRTSASLRVEKYEGGIRLVGGTNGTHPIKDAPSVAGIYGSDTAPIPTLEFGRKRGGVPRGFYYIIREWTREKGLPFASESDRSTFAYFVARKIANEGTKRNTNPVDVYGTPVQTAIARINAILSDGMQTSLRAALQNVRASGLRGAFAD